MSDFSAITLPDGRRVEVMTGGDADGEPWLYHSGSPSAAVPFAAFDRAATDLGLRLITYSRPGYGSSDPRRAPGRIADDLIEIEAVLDSCGVDDFITLGWSGGGPRALACAALLPGRCRAAATLAGVAPFDGEGLDWLVGMAPENRAEYAAAQQGGDAYAAYLESDFMPILQVDLEHFAASLGDLLTPVDQAAVTGELAAYLLATFQRAGAQGVVGVRDDGLAAMSPWGFLLSDVTVPVAVWQGREDAMVPFAHGQWLTAHVPGAHAHLCDDEGHVSLVNRMPEILADLKALAGA